MTTSKIATAFKTATFALAAGAVALGLASPADAAAGTMYGEPFDVVFLVSKQARLVTNRKCRKTG